jgi:hypothetical protein
MDDRKILSIRKRSSDFTFGLHANNIKKGKLERFIDIHLKAKKSIPAPSKYHYSIDNFKKYIS